MASQEELDRARELNELESQRRGISEENLDSLRSASNVIQDQLKFLKFEKSERSEIRSITRDLNKIANDSYNLTLKDLGTQKTNDKLAKDRESVTKRINGLLNLRRSLSERGVKINQDLAISIRDQVEEAVALRNELKRVEEESDRIANSLGVKTFGGIQKIVKSIPGLKALSGPFDAAAQASLESAQANESNVQSLLKGATAFIDTAGLSIGIGTIINSFFKLNNAQTEFRRLTGDNISNIDTLNDSLLTSVQYIEQATALTQQFGFNAAAAFDSINIQEAAELENLMGLAAGEAGNLALFAQVNGRNLKDVNSELFDSIGQINLANKSAVSQKLIFQDIGSVSKSIALTFGGNVKLLGEAATQARILGINLQQVDNIAAGLLDIESSLTAEFEAEVISGKQLNLERARFFALTNDLAGVTKEIANNQEILNSFATGTRIEQEAIAGAIGLSREEIANMIFQQKIQAGISQEEAARLSGMSIEEAKRLSIQESITNSIAKMTQALAGPAAVIADMASNAAILYGTIGLIASVSLARTIAGFATLAFQSQLIAASTITAVSAATLGLGLIAVGAGIAYLASKSKKAQEEIQGVSDGIAPSSKGPFTITDSFGATAITAKGDSLAVSPNIRREGRNDSAPIDYEKLAEAIAKGAERGTSRATVVTNLDGDRISTRLQPSLAVNTRRYSV
jgi:hypothetical protein